MVTDSPEKKEQCEQSEGNGKYRYVTLPCHFLTMIPIVFESSLYSFPVKSA